MKWYNINQAEQMTGKSSRTIRLRLQQLREVKYSNKFYNTMFKYADDNNQKKLFVSDKFLKNYFPNHTKLKKTNRPEISFLWGLIKVSL
jgi:hypothetical protein